ncbi:hypothetical protein D3C80_1305910 [compost metagenome]
MLQADRLDGVVNPRTALTDRQFGLTGKIEAEGDVLFQAQPRQQAGVLECHCQARMRPLQRLAEQADAATARLLQTGQHPQQARLADTTGAENGDHLPRRQLQVEVFQHALPALLTRVAEADSAGFKQHLGHAVDACRCNSARNCTRLGVTIGTNADSRQRRAKPAP